MEDSIHEEERGCNISIRNKNFFIEKEICDMVQYIKKGESDDSDR